MWSDHFDNFAPLFMNQTVISKSHLLLNFFKYSLTLKTEFNNWNHFAP